MILLPFVFLAPFFSFLILTITKHRLSVKQVTSITSGSMLLSFLVALVSSYSYFSVYKLGSVLNITMGGWLYIGDYVPTISLAFDGLSLVMVMLISFLGSLIHIFCSWYLPHQLPKYLSEPEQVSKRYSHYISYLNLLIVAMLLLVLADNLALLYIAWEAVALITFLLLNFDSPKVGKRLRKYASQPSFIPNRIANTFLLVGFFLLANEFGTSNILQIVDNAQLYYGENHSSLMIANASIIIGAMGLSAQLPLHTWLLNVNASKAHSSLIVVISLVLTLGVYLLSRLQPLLSLTPDILFWWVGVIGAISVIVGAISALAQTNIKRLLVFASISQVGFMFIGLGVGAWQSAIFHLIGFSFFQGLLLLAMGCLLSTLDNTANISKMGQLKTELPLLFWSFFFASSALIAFPFLSTSFYSLQGILFQAHKHSHDILYMIALVGIGLTAVYVWRMLWFIFYKQPQQKIKLNPLKGKVYKFPLMVLMILSTSASVLLSPQLTQVLTGILPTDDIEYVMLPNEYLQRIDSGGVSMLATFVGLFIGWLLYNAKNTYNTKNIHHAKNDSKKEGYKETEAHYVTQFTQSRLGKIAYQYAHHGLGLGALYGYVFIRPLFAIDDWLNQYEKTQKDKIKESQDKDKKYQPNLLIKLISGVVHGLLDMQGGSFRGYLIGLVLGLFASVAMIYGYGRLA